MAGHVTMNSSRHRTRRMTLPGVPGACPEAKQGCCCWPAAVRSRRWGWLHGGSLVFATNGRPLGGRSDHANTQQHRHKAPTIVLCMPHAARTARPFGMRCACGPRGCCWGGRPPVHRRAGVHRRPCVCEALLLLLLALFGHTVTYDVHRRAGVLLLHHGAHEPQRRPLPRRARAQQVTRLGSVIVPHAAHCHDVRARNKSQDWGQ